MPVVEAGQPAPDFTLARYEGGPFTRADLEGKVTVLVFYPFAFSPVCTDQLSLYNEVLDDLRERGATLYGVSCDATWSQKAFRESLGVTIPQLSDFEPKGETSRAFGVYFDKESLGKLPPAFVRDGSITAGSSSPISDGASALVVASNEAAARLGLNPIAEIGAHASVAGPDSSLKLQPANAINVAVKKQQISLSDLDLIEINEAFAAVGVASARALGLSADEIDERVNVNGGAVALGHPIGASGARLVLTCVLELKRRGGGTGVAALCGGGGQGDALIIAVPANGNFG